MHGLGDRRNDSTDEFANVLEMGVPMERSAASVVVVRAPRALPDSVMT